MAKLLLREHIALPISGSLLLIGRQTVPLSEADCKALIEAEGIPIRRSARAEYDTRTRGAAGASFISDRSFFGAFCDADVQALDVSDYEGAEVMCDLNSPLPQELCSRFDYIYNGSVLDNVFDPATALKNMTRLLRPGGRVTHLEHGTHLNGPYLMFPPEWFYDYYVVNEFEDCRIYLAFFDAIEKPWDLYRWDPFVESSDQSLVDWRARYPQKRHLFVITFATKGSYSTADRAPIQAQYRSKAETEQYLVYASQFRSSRIADVRHAQDAQRPSVSGLKHALRPYLGPAKQRVVSILRGTHSEFYPSPLRFIGQLK